MSNLDHTNLDTMVDAAQKSGDPAFKGIVYALLAIAKAILILSARMDRKD
jgi:hypothetical protein